MSILAKVRKDMMISGLSEAEAHADGGALQTMFDDLQSLKREKNQVKLEALQKIEEEYQQPTEQLEKRYAMMAKLISRDSSK